MPSNIVSQANPLSADHQSVDRGSAGKNPRLFVIGLDCCDPTLCFDRWLDDLPNLQKLTEQGTFGRLESTTPPITVPAWTCMLTGKDPGEQGFYGFRNRADYTYTAAGGRMMIATADRIVHSRVWDRVSEAGRKAIVVGVPQTYPVKPINGTVVAGFLTPNTQSTFTHPPEFKDEIAQLCARENLGEYMLDVPDFRTDDKVRLLQGIYQMSRQQFALIKHLLKTQEDWSFFMSVAMGPDRIHHGMWKYTDPQHPKYEPGNPFENAIFKYYQFIDAQIGELLALLPQETVVLVMSDHGAQAMQGGICINEWLIEQGYLTLSRPSGDSPNSVANGQRFKLEQCEIDWSKTKAWGAGGYYGRLFLNVQGREPEGILPPDQVEAFKAEITAKLEAIADPQGHNIGTRVLRPEKVYREINNIPPDLIVYFGDLAWRSVGSIGDGSVHVFENDTGPDDANHAQEGLYIVGRPSNGAKPSKKSGQTTLTSKQTRHTWRAIAPTMLDILGLDVPADMSNERL